MKTKMNLKSLFFTLLMAVAVMASAQVGTGPGIAAKNVNNRPGVFKVTFYGGETGKVTFSVYNSQGKAVFQETLRDSKEFIRLVNFKDSGVDTYTIEVKDGDNKVEAVVEYSL